MQLTVSFTTHEKGKEVCWLELSGKTCLNLDHHFVELKVLTLMKILVLVPLMTHFLCSSLPFFSGISTFLAMPCFFSSANFFFFPLIFFALGSRSRKHFATSASHTSNKHVPSTPPTPSPHPDPHHAPRMLTSLVAGSLAGKAGRGPPRVPGGSPESPARCSSRSSAPHRRTSS